MANNFTRNNLSVTSIINSQAPGTNLNSNEIYRKNVSDIDVRVRDTYSGIEVTRYPADTPKYYFKLNVNRFQTRDNLLTVRPLSLKKSIILPLPERLVDMHTVKYDVVQMGTAQGWVFNKAYEITRSLQENPNAAARAKEEFNKIIGSQGFSWQGTKNKVQTEIFDKLKKGNDKADWKKMSGQLEESLKGDQPGNLAKGAIIAGEVGLPSKLQPYFPATGLQAMTGLVPNRFEVVLLHGPQFKKHSFSWNFSPRSTEEAETLNLIIRKLNNYMSPGLTAAGALFTFPMIFTTEFVPNSDYIFKFKPSVLTNFDVMYNRPDEIPAFHKDSKPTDIRMAMTFLELEYWLTGQFKGSRD